MRSVNLQSRVQRNGLERGIRDARTWTWRLLEEKASDYGPGWVQAWSVGDGGQIEHIPLFRD